MTTELSELNSSCYARRPVFILFGSYTVHPYQPFCISFPALVSSVKRACPESNSGIPR